MTIGIMEVELISARGLKNTEFFGGGIDPYVLVQYRGQEHKSSVAAGAGSAPVWNEKFTLRAEYPGGGGDDQYKLILKIMDHDTFSSDDYLGQATIYIEEMLSLGVENGSAEIHPQKYRIVDCNSTYYGEIKVGITFTPKIGMGTQQEENEMFGEDIGGWKESEYNYNESSIDD